MHLRFLLRGSQPPAAEEIMLVPLVPPPRPSPTRRLSAADEIVLLPVLDPRSAAARREIRSLRRVEKKIHFVPLVVLLCLLILWWFCYPVIVEMEEGRVVAIHRLDQLSSLNDTSTRS